MLRLFIWIAVIAAELVVLVFLCKPRAKADAPDSALYFLREAQQLLPTAATRRDYKKLVRLVSRAQEKIDRARLQNAYDLDDVVEDAAAVKRLCAALYTVCPDDPAPYAPYIVDAIASCCRRLSLRAGGRAAPPTLRKTALRTARKERAHRLLESVRAPRNNSDISGQ